MKRTSGRTGHLKNYAEPTTQISEDQLSAEKKPSGFQHATSAPSLEEELWLQVASGQTSTGDAPRGYVWAFQRRAVDPPKASRRSSGALGKQLV